MNTYNTDLNERAYAQLQENRNWFLVLGASLIVIGTLAVVFSCVSTVFSVIYFGAFLMVLGVLEGVQSFKLTQWSSFILHIFLAVLYIVGGFFIVAHPIINAITLTLLLAIFFVVSGILKLFFALTRSLPHRGWLALSGALTLLLGILIWQQWPLSGFWVIGVFMGIDAIFAGLTLIMLAMAANKEKYNNLNVYSNSIDRR